MYYSTLVAFIPYKIRKRPADIAVDFYNLLAYGPFRKEKEKKSSYPMERRRDLEQVQIKYNETKLEGV